MTRCAAICLFTCIALLYVYAGQTAAAGHALPETSEQLGTTPQNTQGSSGGNDATTSRAVSVTSPSICIQATSTCHVVGGIVNVAVLLGESESFVVLAQFSIDYNPSALRFLDIVPGAAADAQSPFSLEILRDIDELQGSVGYAVGVDVDQSGEGTQGPATLAVLSFEVLSQGTLPVCLIDAGNPFYTQLSGPNGESVPIDNSSACAPSDPLPLLACAEIEVSESCNCDVGTPDCSLLDTDCATGFCHDQTGECEATPTNEGGPCDDGSVCTTADTCKGGVCTGAGCPNPSVCVSIDDECEAKDGTFTAKVTLGATQTNDLITAAQLFLEFDANAIEFVSAEAGVECDPDSPFIASGFLDVDNDLGTVFLAVTVNPEDFAAGAGTMGPATLACLTFRVAGPRTSELCLVSGVNPKFTLLANQFGFSVPINNSEDCPPPPGISAISCDETCIPIPAVSEWGLATLALLLACAGKIRFGRIRRPARPNNCLG